MITIHKKAAVQKKRPPETIRRPERFSRVIVKIAAFFLALILFFTLFLAALSLWLNSPPAAAASGVDGIRFDADGAALVEVRRGETARSVGNRLEQAGLIRSRHFWQALSRLDRGVLKSGTYRCEIPASQIAIRGILVAGKQMLQRVTIPEGVTLKKTARLLEDAGICPTEEFLAAAASPEIRSRYRVPGATMEGYLFPDTYLFPSGYPADRAVCAMADTFFLRLAEIDTDAPQLNAEELNRRVIIASIVEREYRLDEEAPLMAGVFYNRLAIGMALQSCATVEYVITEIQGRPHPEVLYTRDTEIKNPYNTYLTPGLPPGPISAPGMTALSAALRPAKSGYLYFRLTDPAAGRHYFSRTLDDHIRAGALYVKKRR
jgi:UPF0755 protein